MPRYPWRITQVWFVRNAITRRLHVVSTGRDGQPLTSDPLSASLDAALSSARPLPSGVIESANLAVGDVNGDGRADSALAIWHDGSFTNIPAEYVPEIMVFCPNCGTP